MDVIDNYEVFTLNKGDNFPYLENYKLNKVASKYLIIKDKKYYGNGTLTIIYKNKIIHNENDLPAIEIKFNELLNISNFNIKIWVKHGLVHRDTIDDKGDILPAIVFAEEDTPLNKFYYINNKVEYVD